MSFREPEGQLAHWIEELQTSLWSTDQVHNMEMQMARKCLSDRLHAQLQQFPVSCPMERVGIDVLCLFPLLERGNHYILRVMEYFTIWTEAYCLLDQEAETIADALRSFTLSPVCLQPCVKNWVPTRPAPLSSILRVMEWLQESWLNSWP